MLRVSMNELTTFRWSFDEDLHHYRQAGFGAIGVWRRKLLDFGVDRARVLLDESGLAVSNLHWIGGFTGIDGRTLNECVTDARGAIDTAALLGAGAVVCYTGGRNNHTSRHARRLVADALRKLAEHAHGRGVTLALKPMHPACAGEWSTLTSLRQAFELLAELGEPALKLVLDTYHFPSTAEELAQISAQASSIALVRLGDWREPRGVDMTRCPLGKGQAMLRQALSTLVRAGYAGDLDIQLMGAAEHPADYPALLTASRASALRLVAQAESGQPAAGAPAAAPNRQGAPSP